MFSVGEDGSKAAFDRLSHECKVREQLMNCDIYIYIYIYMTADVRLSCQRCVNKQSTYYTRDIIYIIIIIMICVEESESVQYIG